MTERRPSSLIHMVRKLLHLMTSRQRLQVAGLLAAMSIGALLEMIGIGAIPAFAALVGSPERVVNNQLVRRYLGDLRELPHASLLLYAAGVLLALFLIKNVYLFGLLIVQSGFTQRFQAALAVRVLRAYLYAPYHMHLQRNPSELLRNANSESLEIIASVVMPGMILTMELLTVSAILTLLFLAAPGASLFTCALLGGTAFLFVKTIRRRLSRYGAQIQQYRGQMIQAVHESLSSIKVTKILGREEYFLDTFGSYVNGYVEASRFRQIATEMPRLCLEIVAITGLLGVAAVLTLQGQPAVSVTVTLSLLAVALVRAIPSVNRITSSLSSLRFGDFALDVISKDLSQSECARGPAHVAAKQRLALREQIRFDEVEYRYPGADSASLKGVSLRITRGSSVAIIGPTGAGKTTLVDLLLGLLSPTHGTIWIDDQDLQANVGAWQRSVGYVPQDIYLLDNTIRRNIALGIRDEEIDDEAVRRAVGAAQLESFIESLSLGLETVVGERGVRISGGQRQRIGIARALYHDPSVLILDEATSSLDSETEGLVIQAVERLRGSRTIIVIAHRLSTVRNCDLAFVLRDGGLAASGPVADFMDRSHESRLLTPVR